MRAVRPRKMLCALLLGVAEPAIAAEQPELVFPPPQGWIRSLMAPEGGAGFVAPSPPARLDVYPFRPHSGGLEPAFSKTLLVSG